VWAVALSPDGRLLATGGKFGVVLWDFASGRELGRARREGVAGGPRCAHLSFSPGGTHLAGAFVREPHLVGDPSALVVRLWETGGGRLGRARTLLSAKYAYKYPDPIPQVVFSPDGRWLASGSPDGTARVWDVRTGRESFRVPGKGVTAGFSPDGKLLLAVDSDGTITQYDARTGRARGARKDTDFLQVLGASFVPGGRWLALSDAYTVSLQDAAGRAAPRRLGVVESVFSLTLSPDAGLLAVGVQDGLRILETASGQERYRLAAEGPLAAVAFSPGGRSLVVAEGREVRVRRLSSLPAGERKAPPGPRLEARLVARTRTYPLDLGGLTAREFARRVEHGPHPPSPEVDLVCVLRNVGGESLILDTGIWIDLHLLGKGAFNHMTIRRQTGWTPPLGETGITTLAPGGEYSLPVKRVGSGSYGSYWLRPGSFAVHGTCRVMVSALPGGDGKGEIRLGATTFHLKGVTLELAPAVIEVRP
jgi:hypothetical protein